MGSSQSSIPSSTTTTTTTSASSIPGRSNSCRLSSSSKGTYTNHSKGSDVFESKPTINKLIQFNCGDGQCGQHGSSHGKSGHHSSIKSLSIMTNKLLGADHCNHNHTHSHNQKQTNISNKNVKNSSKRNILTAIHNKGNHCKKEITNKDEEQQQRKSCEMKGKNQVDSTKHSSKNDDPNLERRRASIRNGDVFIYPSIYTDLNECHKCFRDKLICNCNDSLTTITIGNATTANTTSNELSSSSKQERELEKRTKEAHESDPNSNDKTTLHIKSSDEDCKSNSIHSSNCIDDENLRSEPSIGITTCKISVGSDHVVDQKSNQIRYSKPKVLITSKINKCNASAKNIHSNNSDEASKRLDKEQTNVATFKSCSPPVKQPRTTIVNDNSNQNSNVVCSIVKNKSNFDYNHPNDHDPIGPGAVGGAEEEDSSSQVKNKNADCQRIIANYRNLSTVTSCSSAIVSTDNNSLKSSSSSSLLSLSSPTNSDYKSSSLLSLKKDKIIMKNKDNEEANFEIEETKNVDDDDDDEINEDKINSSISLNDINNNLLEIKNKIGNLCDNVKNNDNQSTNNNLNVDFDEQTKENGHTKLTCDLLNFVDSINITSATSIHFDQNDNQEKTQQRKSTSTNNSLESHYINCNKPQQQIIINKYQSLTNDDNTSVVPIETLSKRRRNLITTKFNQQPIHEDDDSYRNGDTDCIINNKMEKNDGNQKQESTYSKSQQIILLPGTLDIKRRESLDLPSAQQSPSNKDDNSEAGNGDVFEYSPILTSVRDYIKNFNTELQVQTASATAGVQIPTESCLAITTAQRTMHQTISYVSEQTQTTSTSVSGTLVLSPLTVVTTASANSVPLSENDINLQSTGTTTVISLSGAETGLESPKKSIFDGASKDEILEYLEDARERVPEILMAADDVMVINENELIVVNQLEPDSPATPISIIDKSEVIQNKNSINTNIYEEIETPSAVVDSIGNDDELNNPDQLKQHLRQIYKSSQLANNSQFSSGTETMDDEILHQQIDGNSSRQNSSTDNSKSLTDSIDTTNNSSYSNPVFSDLKTLSSSTRTTLDSVDSVQANILIDNCSSPEFKNNELLDRNQHGKVERNQEILLRRHSSRRKNFKLDHMSIYHGNNNNENKTLTALLNNINNNSTNVYDGRRNSASDETGPIERNCTLQMLMMMQRYSNHNSLSSSSSSPPSSTSPSSSTSSNQTSGNCSATSNFYASSSLSCSSPLLVLSNQITPFNSSPGFNNMTKQLPSANIKYGLDNLSSTFNSNILESFMKDAAGTNEPERNDSSCLATSKTDQDIKDSNITELVNDENNFSNSTGKLFTYKSGQSKPITNVIHSATTSDFQQSNNNNNSNKLCVIQEINQKVPEITNLMSFIKNNNRESLSSESKEIENKPLVTSSSSSGNRNAAPTFSSSANLMSRTIYGHYATMNRLNNYFMNRHPLDNTAESTVEFQCLDCDQFIDVDHAKMLNKTNEIRLLKVKENNIESVTSSSIDLHSKQLIKEKPMSPSQLDRAYIAAMNGLPLCKSCEKKRIERKEIIAEFVETELKYGRDLKIIHEEFYRPMQIAGLLSKDQINGVFLNLDELIMAHCKFADILTTAINDANQMGDTDYNTVNIGKLFVESSEMLHAFESYCIRQGAAACLLARLAKEKELLRIFLRVSQMENVLLRRMNLAAFLMVPVQRVTRYPLLLNRLYKVTAYHHKDREALRDAQLKVELHLEHINQQTKGVGATNKIWRRISNLSAPTSNRRGLINAEDIGYIKLRKTAMDMLKWDRDDTQFIHSGKLNFTPLNEFLTKQKSKSMRYMTAHALLIVLGKPNWKYRPDLVKSNLDNKLMIPTLGGNGIREAALLLFREKNGRFVPCREPLFLSNCLISADCSQYNSDSPSNQSLHHSSKVTATTTTATTTTTTNNNNNNNNNQHMGSNGSSNYGVMKAHQRLPTTSESSGNESKSNSIDSTNTQNSSIALDMIGVSVGSTKSNTKEVIGTETKSNSMSGDAVSMSSLKSLIEEQGIVGGGCGFSSPPPHTSRSYSLASALPRSTITTNISNPTSLQQGLLSKSTCTTSSNTIFNQLITKVNNYHNKQQTPKSVASLLAENQTHQHHHHHSKSSPSSTTLSTNFSQGSSLELNHVQQFNQQQQSQQQQQQNHSQSSSNENQSYREHLTANARFNNNHSPSSFSQNSNSNSETHQHYNHHYFHNHHQPYGDYEESFEIHERLTKESLLLRADTTLKTRYWLQMLRYHAKDLGQWRSRRGGLANIMMVRQD